MESLNPFTELGFALQAGDRCRPGKLNGEKQSSFVQAYDELKQNKKDDEVILFGGGVHPTHNLYIETKAWIKKGEEKQVKTNILAGVG